MGNSITSYTFLCKSDVKEANKCVADDGVSDGWTEFNQVKWKIVYTLKPEQRVKVETNVI